MSAMTIKRVYCCETIKGVISENAMTAAAVVELGYSKYSSICMIKVFLMQ